MARERIAATIDGWQQLVKPLADNAADLPHLEGHRARLEELLRKALELSNQQAALTASKQEVSKQLQEVLAEGRTVATFMRVGVREKYGRGSEKLLEFRVRPFRGIRRQEEETETPGGEPAKADSAPAAPEKQS